MRLWGTCVEQSWGSMSKEFSTHQIICFNCLLYAIFVNSQSYSHEHVLRPFDDFSINLEKVSSFQGFEAEKIKGEVPFKVYGFVDLLVMLMNDLINSIRKEGSISSTLIFAVVKLIGDVEH